MLKSTIMRARINLVSQKLKNKHQIQNHWTILRKELFRQVQSHVQILLGEEGSGLASYRQVYEKEFSSQWTVANKAELLSSVRRVQFIFIGDFHAIPQSQKAQLRILRMLDVRREIILAVEFFEAKKQIHLDNYLQGKITEKEFLKAIEWKRNWGFPWDHYRGLLRWAIKNQIRVVGINIKLKERSSKTLEKRDLFSAKELLKIHHKNPAAQVVVIYGDLHLARPHLLKPLKERLKQKFEDVAVVIYQNSEKIFFQLLDRGIETEVDLVRLGKNRYCLLSVPPWVKWQNYLLFLEQHTDKSLSGDWESDFTDHVARLVQVLGQLLDIPVNCDAFSIYSAKDSNFWDKLESLPSLEKKIYEEFIEKNQSFFIPQLQVGYLARPTVNQAAGLAMEILIAQFIGIARFPTQMPQEFLHRIWFESIKYFGTKLINPKRKSDTLADLKALASSRDSQLKEALQIALRQKMNELLILTQGKLIVEDWKRKRKNSFFEAAILLGGMLGEKIFTGFHQGSFSGNGIKSLLGKDIWDKQFPSIYYENLELIESIPAPFKSKADKL